MWFKKKKDIVLFIGFSFYNNFGREFFGSRVVRLEHDVNLVDFHSDLPAHIASKVNCKPDDVRIISIARL